MSSRPPLWGSKLGDMAGWSPHTAPSVNPWCPGPRVSMNGSSISPLIDGHRNIYCCSAGETVTKLDEDGLLVWRASAGKDRGTFSATPALLDGALLAQTNKGWALSISMQTGKENWSRKFCDGGCMTDLGAVAAHAGTMVLAGRGDKQSETYNFNTHVYALDARSGKEKWQIKPKLGLTYFVPSIVDKVVVFQTPNGEACCHKLSDGALEWMTKQTGQGTTGGVVVCQETGTVYSTANKRGKPDWNAPRGGKGLLRALSLKTGDLKWERDLLDADGVTVEANAVPAVAPVAPGGGLLVIVPCGANPGTWSQPSGHEWKAFVAAFDARDGSLVWRSDLVFHNGKGPGGTFEHDPEMRDRTAVCWSNPVACASGSVFIGWHNLKLFEYDGATGQTRGSLDANPYFQAGVAIGPGMLVACSLKFMFIYKEHDTKSKVLQELEIPFDESGNVPFWQNKMRNFVHTTFCPLSATADFSEPAWVAGDIEKHFARSQGNHFYHMTPLVDSQRNTYIATYSGQILVVRPDGKLRGYIDCGEICSQICLYERGLFGFTSAGFTFMVDIETLTESWRSYISTGHRFIDGGTPVICPQQGVALTAGVNDPRRTAGPAQCILGLNSREYFQLKWARTPYRECLDFLPSVWDERDYFIFADCAGGIYCWRISDASTLWEHQAAADNNERGVTKGHCASGPNDMIYHAWNLAATAKNPFGVWNEGAGAGGAVRACVVPSGVVKWTRRFPHECNVTPVVAPKGDGSDGYVVVVAQGSQGGHAPPGDGRTVDDEDHSWPTGDAWQNFIRGLDSETGDELWCCTLPVWNHYEARGSYQDSLFMPQCFSNPTATADGNVYLIHWSGTLYCLDADTGAVVSSADIGAASDAAVVIVPGMILVSTAYKLLAFRDGKLEQRWLEQAREEGDKRADPRLWKPGKHQQSQADEDALTVSLRVSLLAAPLARPKRVPVPEPSPAYSRQTWEARCARRLAARPPEHKPQLGVWAVPPANPWGVAAPSPAPASAEARNSLPEAGAGPLWVVVGGGQAGGIMVRGGQNLKSKELGRLSTGAKVREVELHGERLSYKKVSGEGPEHGWVSLSLKGAALLKPA